MAAVVGLLVWVYTPWPLYYRQDPIRAKIVDKQSGQPVPGAAVVAVWLTVHGGWEQTWTVYRVGEARTDSNGRFMLAGWGPDWRWNTHGKLEARTPEIYIYKPGYKALQLHNVADRHWNGAIRYSDWNDKGIEIDRAQSPHEEASALGIADRLYKFDLDQLPLFWRTWVDGWRRLPPEQRDQITPDGPAITLMKRDGLLR